LTEGPAQAGGDRRLDGGGPPSRRAQRDGAQRGRASRPWARGAGAAREGGRTRPGARRPKKVGRPHRETRESLLTVQGLMREEGTVVSIAQLCRWFGVARSTFYYRPPPAAAPRVPVVDTALERTIRGIIDADPAAGLRMITARVRRDAATPVNRKKIHRILKLNQWQVRQRPHGHRPRVQGW